MRAAASYSLIAPAKINLFLSIIGDRPDGFHELVMVMQSVALADRVTVRSIDDFALIVVTCDDDDVPQDESNLAYKAALVMQSHFPAAAAKHGGIAVHIEKQIPMGAGLAGGSADCAAVLVGIDLLWKLGLTQAELRELAAEIGSDIAFCIAGGTAMATGRGEIIDPLPDLDNLFVVLAKYRDLPVATPWAYKTFRTQFGMTYPQTPQDLASQTQKIRSGKMLAAIAKRDTAAICQHLHNDLEKVVLPQYPQIQGLRQAFLACDQVLGTMMSGSGSTVFGLCATAPAASAVRDQMQQQFNDPNLQLWVTKFAASGVQIAP
jgi:4-diphosphocytidyl-2-C-methyl-D-erythritol kinase